MLSISPVSGFLWQLFIAPWSLGHIPCCSSHWGLQLRWHSEGLPTSWQEATEEKPNILEALMRQCYAQVKCDNTSSEFKLPTRFVSSGRVHNPECPKTTQMSLLRQHRCLKKVLENCPPCFAA